MNDTKYKVVLKITKGSLLLLFGISLFFSMRWSALPMLPMPEFLNKCFLKPDDVDASMLNLATGYVSGYIVYLITAFIPAFIRNRPIELEAAKRLSALYQRNIIVLLLMCKNVCTESEWTDLLRDTDLATFNEKYYEKMKQFDVRACAETIYLHKDSGTRLAWHEYLQYICSMTSENLDEIFLKFHAYLQEDTLQLIADMRNSVFISLFTGSANVVTENEGSDGYTYFDNAGLSLYYCSEETRYPPVFSATALCDNTNIIREYVSILSRLNKHLKDTSKQASVENNYAIKKLSRDKVGHYNTAVFKYK